MCVVVGERVLLLHWQGVVLVERALVGELVGYLAGVEGPVWKGLEGPALQEVRVCGPSHRG